MLNQLSNLSLWLLFICFLTVPSTVILLIHSLSMKKQIRILMVSMEDTRESNARMIMRVSRYRDEQVDTMKELSDQVSSLSSSNARVLEELVKKRNTPTLPRPDLVKEIEATIQEHITIETLLSADLRIPSADMTHYISEKVCLTYPEVDIEYIGRKTLSMINAYNKGT